MVVQESEMNNLSQGEAESQLQTEQEANKLNNNNNNNNPFSSLGSQSSIYSLTLDEFQHTLCDTGKNFGSMNMDEFLSSIWNAEENQAAITNNNTTTNNNNINNNNNMSLNNEASSTDRGMMIRKQPSLPRQGSLTLPAPLCRKTVEEVWSEIHKGQQSQQQQQQHQQHQHKSNNNAPSNNNSGRSSSSVQNNTETAPRQPTFGEMTLEDFLVKAGVVREPCAMPAAVPAAAANSHHQYMGVYGSNNTTIGPSSFVGIRPVIGGGGGGGGVGSVVAPPYQGGEPSGGYGGNNGGGKRDGAGYPPAGGGGGGVGGVCSYGGRVVNGGGGGYGARPSPTMGMGGPLSPASSDGVEMMAVLRGRKRMVDGPVEKVVERRQRRMIKNRESAARSRARKQAYTVELEAELNQLREENAQLKQALADLETRRRQQCFEDMNVRVQTRAQKATEKLRALRRNLSCPL